jgi:PAS domain S-box-containing protein
LQSLLQHETAARAHDRWVAQGCPPGTHLRDWLEAEAELGDLRALAQRLAENNSFLRDYITARERIESALEATEERFQLLFREGLTGNVLSRPDGTLVLCNPAFARLFGFPSAQEALRVSLADLFPTPQAHAELLQEVCAHKVLDNREEEMVRADGRRFAVLMKAVGLFAADGLLEQVQLYLLDVSERKQAEDAVRMILEARRTQEELEARVRERTADLARANEALRQEVAQHRRTEENLQRQYGLLQAIIEGTTDAVFVKDREGRYLMINTAGARFLGRPVADILGKDDTAVFSPETGREIMETDRRIMAEGRIQTIEDVGTAAGVTRTYLATKGPYRDGQGKVIGLIGISRDITERKQVQQRLQAEHDVTRALAEAETLPEAAGRILRAVGENLGWDIGIFWAVHLGGEALHFVGSWQAPGMAAPELEKTSRELSYSKGMGLPGQAWLRGEPVWISNVARDLKILYRGPVAQQEGLHTAAAFPVRAGEECLGALEFFCRDMRQPDPGLLASLGAITSQISQFMERKKVERALHERAREFAIAREIQQGLLPRAAPELPGFAIAGASHPAQETGGDYFDFCPLGDGKLGVLIGDASGHGIGAALLMAVTRAYLRALVLTHAEMGAILSLVNRRLDEDTAEDHYVTLLFAALCPVTRTLTYSNAGHWPGYLLDGRGQVKVVLGSTGTVLSFDPAGHFPPAPPLPLEGGDLVLLCTDGFAEAFSRDEIQFSRERVLDVVRAHQQEPPDQIIEALCREVREFSGGQQVDDMTAVVIKVS